MKLLDYYRSKRPKEYSESWHHKLICGCLERAFRERLDFVLEAPPRHSKSELCDIYAPAWRLDTHPLDRFGMVSNSDSLAKMMSTSCRKLVTWPVGEDQKNAWRVDVPGVGKDFTFHASGIHGQLAGHGFDCLILDDVQKSGQDVLSDAKRDSVWTDVVSAALNRLSPTGIVIFLQARLHRDDVLARYLQLPRKRVHLRLPATNQNGDRAFVDNRKLPAYEALWPTQYPAEWLKTQKKVVGDYYFSAQYQQEPSLGDLAIFKVEAFPRWNSAADVVRTWWSWDTANTKDSGSAYSAGTLLGKTNSGLVKVLFALKGRWSFADIGRNIFAAAEGAARQFGLPEAVIIEKAASGFGLISELQRCTNLPIRPVTPRGSKEDRAASVTGIANYGGLAIPASAEWLEWWLPEVRDFPLGQYRDAVDSLVHGLAYIARPADFAVPEPVTQVVSYDPLEEYMSLGGGLPDLDEEMLGSQPELIGEATLRALRRGNNRG
ncbi:MAG: hypothetical protein ACRD3L_10910 [Terriglobales bacterium]